jgi:23S rRNA (adenine1618-N6)-methyltransferase
MIRESVQFKDQCRWFTTLVSKQENLKSAYKTLKTVGADEVNTIEMQLGNKVSRILAWRF